MTRRKTPRPAVALREQAQVDQVRAQSKQQALDALESGERPAEVARRLGLPPTTVAWWARKLDRAQPVGRPAGLPDPSPRVLAQLEGLAAGRTREAIAAELGIQPAAIKANERKYADRLAQMRSTDGGKNNY